MVRGDVILVDLPRPISNAGHEQFGTRPAIILQEEEPTAVLSTVVVVPLTGILEAVRFWGSFLINPSRTNGLDKKSIALTQQIVTIDKRRIARRIGKLAAHDLATLEQNLRKLLGL